MTVTVFYRTERMVWVGDTRSFRPTKGGSGIKPADGQQLVHLHDRFWLTEAAHEGASPPAMPKRGEKCELPPALVFGGDRDVGPDRADAELCGRL
jgi:hypothetical protein